MQSVPATPPALQHTLPSHVVEQPRIEPSPPSGLALRLAILACLIAAMAHAMTLPVERTVHDLQNALWQGNVASVTMERPAENLQGSGSMRVEWTESSGRDGYARYTYTVPAGQPGMDEGADILAAIEESPAPVDVTVYEGPMERSGLTWSPVGLAMLAALMVLIFGPQPRLATKWAWFWLGCAVPILWLVFLVLEPVPAWRRRAISPVASRFTGGWAFLIALVLGAIWQTIAPF